MSYYITIYDQHDEPCLEGYADELLACGDFEPDHPLIRLVIEALRLGEAQADCLIDDEMQQVRAVARQLNRYVFATEEVIDFVEAACPDEAVCIFAASIDAPEHICTVRSLADWFSEIGEYACMYDGTDDFMFFRVPS